MYACSRAGRLRRKIGSFVVIRDRPLGPTPISESSVPL